jgi:hypothetical protein
MSLSPLSPEAAVLSSIIFWLCKYGYAASKETQKVLEAIIFRMSNLPVRSF